MITKQIIKKEINKDILGKYIKWCSNLFTLVKKAKKTKMVKLLFIIP